LPEACISSASGVVILALRVVDGAGTDIHRQLS